MREPEMQLGAYEIQNCQDQMNICDNIFSCHHWQWEFGNSFSKKTEILRARTYMNFDELGLPCHKESEYTKFMDAVLTK
jgi:hypothetical protein